MKKRNRRKKARINGIMLVMKQQRMASASVSSESSGIM